MVKYIHDSHGTVSNIFGLYWEILYWIFEIFAKNALTQSIFEVEKCSFFTLVRISPEIDWYHYQGASTAPMNNVHSPASNNDRDPYELSVTWEPSVSFPAPPLYGIGLMACHVLITLWLCDLCLLFSGSVSSADIWDWGIHGILSH